MERATGAGWRRAARPPAPGGRGVDEGAGAAVSGAGGPGRGGAHVPLRARRRLDGGGIPPRPRAPVRRGGAPGDDAGGTAPRRPRDRARWARPPELRLARPAAADGARVAAGRARSRRGGGGQPADPAAGRCPVRAGPAGSRASPRARGQGGPGVPDHRRRRARGERDRDVVGRARRPRERAGAGRRERSGVSAETYTASDIKVLEELEAVRKRPAMYIGDTGAYGLHQLVYEAVDNAVDEALAGYCDSIKVILHSNGSCSVGDNGRGIPVDIHKESGKPAAEVVLTVLHSGGKFEHSAYKVSGGLHGVGISVVNALSESLDIEIRRGGHVWTQHYQYGVPQDELTPGEKTNKHGTIVRFKPDTKIFEETAFSFDTLSNRLRELAFLNKGLKIVIEDERDERSHAFLYKGGIIEFVKHLNQNKTPIHPKVLYFERKKGDIEVEVALQ